jgi:hypothetical protein
VKLQIVASNKRTNSDPEAGNEGTVRSKTPSRKKQRQMDKKLREATRDGTSPESFASPLSTSGTAATCTGLRDLMETTLQATRFNQKFALSKFCVEQDIEGGKEMIQAMMANEMRKECSGTKKKVVIAFYYEMLFKRILQFSTVDCFDLLPPFFILFEGIRSQQSTTNIQRS